MISSSGFVGRVPGKTKAVKTDRVTQFSLHRTRRLGGVANSRMRSRAMRARNNAHSTCCRLLPLLRVPRRRLDQIWLLRQRATLWQKNMSDVPRPGDPPNRNLAKTVMGEV